MRESSCDYASGLVYTVRRVILSDQRWCPSPAVSYPFIATEGSSVSTQAAELTKRFSGGRAELFPATFLETIVTTQLGRDSKTKKEKKNTTEKALWAVQRPSAVLHECITFACFSGKLPFAHLSLTNLCVRKRKNVSALPVGHECRYVPRGSAGQSLCFGLGAVLRF